MNKLNIVITMAGAGNRFKEAGYVMPKYEIIAHGKTLFEWSFSSLIGFLEYTEQIIFIVLKENDSSSFIESTLKKHKIKYPHYEVVAIDEITDGQATTAYLARNMWKKNNSLLIYNIDTYVEPGIMTFQQIQGDGFIPCFNGVGNHWSFVKLDDTGKALEVKEKERISNNSTIGAYYFKSCALYEQLYLDYYNNNAHITNLKEKYVAPLYNQLIEQGGEVYISTLPANVVHVLGTPEELDKFTSILNIEGTII